MTNENIGLILHESINFVNNEKDGYKYKQREVNRNLNEDLNISGLDSINYSSLPSPSAASPSFKIDLPKMPENQVGPFATPFTHRRRKEYKKNRNESTLSEQNVTLLNINQHQQKQIQILRAQVNKLNKKAVIDKKNREKMKNQFDLISEQKNNLQIDNKEKQNRIYQQTKAMQQIQKRNETYYKVTGIMIIGTLFAILWKFI